MLSKVTNGDEIDDVYLEIERNIRKSRKKLEIFQKFRELVKSEIKYAEQCGAELYLVKIINFVRNQSPEVIHRLFTFERLFRRIFIKEAKFSIAGINTESIKNYGIGSAFTLARSLVMIYSDGNDEDYIQLMAMLLAYIYLETETRDIIYRKNRDIILNEFIKKIEDEDRLIERLLGEKEHGTHF